MGGQNGDVGIIQGKDALFTWVKSNRRRSGVTKEPACSTCVPNT